MARSFSISLDDPAAGKKIADIRKQEGVTQKDLANRLGSHWTTIHRLEHGKINITMDWCVHISEALGVNIDYGAGSSAVTDRFNIAGEIRDNGYVIEHTKLRISWPIPFKGRNFWCLMQTDDYWPACQRNDLIQLTEIEDHEWGQACDRICLVRKSETGSMILGILDGPMFKDEVSNDLPFRLINMKSETIAEMPFGIIGVLTGVKSAFADDEKDIAEKPITKS